MMSEGASDDSYPGLSSMYCSKEDERIEGIPGLEGKPRIRSQAARGFTLTELLAVVAILILLGATVATGLASARPNSKTFQCLNNLRQLGVAWRMYSDENLGKLVFNHDGGNTGKSYSDASWAGGWLDFSFSSDNTNIDLLLNHTKYAFSAFLGPYLRTATVFKCPSDKSTFATTSIPRVRTVSMNSFMGKGTRTWITPSAYSRYENFAQIGSPPKVFVFLDEREDSINDALFWTDPDTRFQMVDYPAGYHETAGNFNFADGHGETHRWTDPRTTPPITPRQLLRLNLNLPGDLDIDWLQQHASEHR